MKCFKNLYRKYIIWKFERLMYNLTYGGTRKKGISDATVYRMALHKIKWDGKKPFMCSYYGIAIRLFR